MSERDPISTRRWTVVGVGLPMLLTVLLLGSDIAYQREPSWVGTLTASPLLASALVGPGWTALVGAWTIGLSVAYGFFQDSTNGPGTAITTREHWARLFLMFLATLLAVAVARVRLRRLRQLARVTQISEVAQRTILPDLPHHVGGMACAGRYQSATSEAHVGGDLYEVLATIHGVRALIGDARGKGIDAVRVSGYVLGCFRALAWSDPDLGRLTQSLDQAVRRIGGPEDFVTASLVELHDAGHVRVVVCGHPSPLVIPPFAAPITPHGNEPAGLPVRPLLTGEPDLPLGLLDTMPQVHQVTLVPCERILLLTDGLIEARRAGVFLDVERTVSIAFQTGHLDEALDAILAQVHEYVRGEVVDDLALLALEVVPQPSPA